MLLCDLILYITQTWYFKTYTYQKSVAHSNEENGQQIRQAPYLARLNTDLSVTRCLCKSFDHLCGSMMLMRHSYEKGSTNVESDYIKS